MILAEIKALRFMGQLKGKIFYDVQEQNPKMACECEKLTRAGGIVVHEYKPADVDLCKNIAESKHNVDGDSLWLCEACIAHG